VTADLARTEYAATPTAAGLQAPNRAHNLRTTFTEQGIEVLPRTAKDMAPAWRFAWATTAVGRAGGMQAASPASPRIDGSRVVYPRDGWSEWYENTPEGLEQGFTIERRPEGEGPVRIAGRFPASLRAEVREDGEIDFLDDHGACVIRYGELHAWDARGVELPAELVLADPTLSAAGDRALSIVVDDHEATYPITIDPLMTSPAWIAESNQAGALLGFSVSTAGEVKLFVL
jgi:hypothetical protein